MNSKSRIFTLHYAASLWIKPLREIIISDLLNFLCSLWKNPSFGKGSLLLAVFWPPLGCMRMGLAPGILLHQEMESSQGCAGLVTLSDSVSLCFTQCVLLCSALSMWVLWHLPNPTAISPLHREDGGEGASRYTTRGACAGQLPWVGFWEGPAGHGRPVLTEAALAVLFSASKALLQPIPDRSAFPQQLWYQDTLQKCPDFRSRCQALPKPNSGLLRNKGLQIRL